MNPAEFETISILLMLSVLFLASIIDFRTHKIPNKLALALLLSGLILQSLDNGLNGIVDASIGIGISLGLLFPLFYVGGIGAGDVKLMAAAGSFMNASLTLLSILMSVYFATFMGILLLVVRGGVRAYLSRYILMAKTCLLTGQLLYIPPKDGEVAKQTFPCAIAIALGCSTAVLFKDSLMAL